MWKSLIIAASLAIAPLQPLEKSIRQPTPEKAQAASTAARIDAIVGRVDQARLMKTVIELPTRRAARADEGHLEGLYQTQQLLVKRLKELGYEPELNEVDFLGSTHDRSRPLYSIVVEIPGQEEVKEGSAREIVIVGAHFDAVPNSPGADDNGTGVAALMEMARVLKNEPMKRTVRLCFFNLEEQGMVGSSKYAAEVGDRIREKKEKITLMLSMDMLGYYRTEKGTQKTFIPEATGFKSPKEGDFIAVVTTLRHRPVCQGFIRQMKLACPEAKVVAVDFLPALTELLRSDHAPFLGMGIPAMLITDTADYRSPHYHKPTDAVGTIDEERFTRTVKAITGAVADAAGLTEAKKAAGK